MTLRRAHLWIGILGTVAFVLTGQYMHHVHGHLEGMPDASRLMFRSAHIYLLYGALLNLALGAYISPLTGRAATRLQLIGSAVVLIVPELLLVSFFAETGNQPLHRPIGAVGIYLSLLGIGLHFIASLVDRKRGDAGA